MWGGNIKGLSGVGGRFRDPSQCEPRACVLVKGCNTILMPMWYKRDLAVIKVDLLGVQGAVRQVVVALAYFSYDSHEPSPPVGLAELLTTWFGEARMLKPGGKHCFSTWHQRI